MFRVTEFPDAEYSWKSVAMTIKLWYRIEIHQSQNPNCTCEKFLDFLQGTDECIFCPNLVAMATPLAPLKILIGYWNSPTQKSPPYMRKISRCLQKSDECIFCPNLVAMATALNPMKFYIPYLNLPTPKTLLFVRKSPRFLAQNWRQCNFGLFLFKFGCHGNSLGSLKNSDSVLKFTSPEIPTVHEINFSIACRELMSAIFLA